MAAVCKTKHGYIIQLGESEDARRSKISVGRMSRKQAESLAAKIANLIRCRQTGDKMTKDLQDWLDGLPDGLRKRFEHLGLISPTPSRKWTVEAWVTHFIETSTKPDSDNRRKIANVGERLRLFFGKDLIASVNTFQCRRFRDYLKEKVELGENTIRRHIGICRQIFNGAIDAGLILKNPFLGQPVTVQPNPSRFFYSYA